MSAEVLKQQIAKELKAEVNFATSCCEIDSIESQQNEITQQPVAQLSEEVFLRSIVSRISWSHHIGLKNKVQNLGGLFGICFIPSSLVKV